MNTMFDLHGGSYRRVTFYFPTGDETEIENYIAIPDYRTPGAVRDLHFKFCGRKLKKSKEFKEFVEASVPSKFRDRFSKSEKGIDIEICCDVFKLIISSRLDRLFLLTNDDDFIPFCRTIKEFGINVSIIHLSEAIPLNASLLREADSFDVVAKEQLQHIFLPMVGPGLQEEPTAEGIEKSDTSLKPDAPPSDLIVDGAAPNFTTGLSDEETDEEESTK